MDNAFRAQVNSTPVTGTTGSVANPYQGRAHFRIYATTLCYLSWTGAATTNDLPIAAGLPELFLAQGGDTIYINNPSSGTVSTVILRSARW